MSKFSDAFAYLRKRDGLSQQELADKMGVSRSTIAMYEADQRKPDFEGIEIIADIFNVDTNFLVGRNDSGNYSNVFKKNLAQIVDNTDKRDLDAVGIDVDEVNLILRGAISLTFDLACELCDTLGVSLDDMLQEEKPADKNDDELFEVKRIFSELNQENRAKLLELSGLYLAAQRNTVRTE